MTIAAAAAPAAPSARASSREACASAARRWSIGDASGGRRLGHGRGQDRRRYTSRTRLQQLEPRVLAEDRSLELSQLRARLEREFVHQQRAHRPVGLERIGLSSGSVESEHELGLEPFAERVLYHERLELGDEGAVPAELEFGFDTVLHGCQPKLVEALDLNAGKRLELEIRQRATAPKRLRLAKLRCSRSRIALLQGEATFHRELLERVQVELTWLDAQQVPRRAGHQPRLAVMGCEHLAQAGDLNSQRTVGRLDRLIPEELLDQPVTGNDTVGAREQQGEQRPLPWSADTDRNAIQ
jgi:hypothetical protein